MLVPTRYLIFLGTGYLIVPRWQNLGKIALTRYEQGRADSLAVLCNLFSKLQPNDKLKTAYVERFYWVLKLGLEADFLSAKSIMLYSQKLFLIGQEGFRLLIPYYIQAFYQFLPFYWNLQDPLCQKEDFERLRRFCYALIGSIGYSINRIGSIKLVPNSGIKLPVLRNDGIDEWVLIS